jgi:antitoxin component HigA of HigAB toxin-antitoxin module
MKSTRLTLADLPTDYAGLVALWPPRAVRDAVDEQNVEEIVLAMAGHSLTPDQEDYLDLLSDLLLKYQRQAHPRRRPRCPLNQRLRYLLDESGMTRGELAKVLDCSQPLVSLILGGRRSLSKENIKKLAAHFRLDAGYFL